MNVEQKRILTENLQYFTNNLKTKEIMMYTRKEHPNIISEGDVWSLNIRTQDARVPYMLDLFKRAEDGYSILYEVLEGTNHSNTVLRTLDPNRPVRGENFKGAEGPNLSHPGPQGNTGHFAAAPNPNATTREEPTGAEGPNPSQPGSEENTNKQLLLEIREMMKMMAKNENLEKLKEEMAQKLDKLAFEFSDLKGEIMQKFGAINYRLESLERTVSSDQITLENVKTTITKLTDDIKEFKEDYRQFLEKYDQSYKVTDSNEYDLFRKVIETLAGLDIKDKDIIWREIKQLRKDVDSFKKLSETVWQLSFPQVFITENVRPIAERIKTIWRSVGEKVGVNMTDIEDMKCQMDDEGKAEVVITRWLEKKDNLLTWTDVISVLSEIDVDVARTVTELKSHNP